MDTEPVDDGTEMLGAEDGNNSSEIKFQNAIWYFRQEMPWKMGRRGEWILTVIIPMKL